VLISLAEEDLKKTPETGVGDPGYIVEPPLLWMGEVAADLRAAVLGARCSRPR
jgi:hypothetical protein